MFRLKVDMHELKADRNHFSNWNPSGKAVPTFLRAVVNIRVNYFAHNGKLIRKRLQTRSFESSRNGTESETMYERLPKTAFESTNVAHNMRQHKIKVNRQAKCTEKQN